MAKKERLIELTVSNLKDMTVAVPPGRESAAIAAFLDRETAKLDALIAIVREAIDRLRELRSALISAAVTGKPTSARRLP